MPKLEMKAIQKELEKGLIWPFYWIYGPEKWKIRELTRKIRLAILGNQKDTSLWGWGEEILDGNEIDAVSIVDAAQSPSLAGGIRYLLIRDAHTLKNPEPLCELFGPPQQRSELSYVCVCISKDLDARKKFSKVLVEKTAVIHCEEVPESQKETWIRSLAQKRGIQLNPNSILRLISLDPWSLDRIEQEIEKFWISGQNEEMISGSYSSGKGDSFLESFFSRQLKPSLSIVPTFADNPDESLPLVGLMSWNLRQLAVLASDRNFGTSHSKLNPYLVERFRKWIQIWNSTEILELQNDLFELDFHLKQSYRSSLGLWTHLVMKHCQS